LTMGVPSGPGDTDVTGGSENPREVVPATTC